MAPLTVRQVLRALQVVGQITLQGLSLLLILLEIPIVFDAGGEECGISFTFLLAVFYFCTATLRSVFHGTRLQLVGSTLYYLQFLILPSLLLIHLSLCPSDNIMRLAEPWRLMLRYATGPFALLEGFCTLIAIQALGYVSHAFSQRSEFVQLALLVVSSLFITGGSYFLLRIYVSDTVIDAPIATLIGAALMVTLFLGIYGIISKRGNALESSLLFSYVVYLIYLSFTDFQSSLAPTMIFPFADGSSSTPKARTIDTNLGKGVLEVLGVTLGGWIAPHTANFIGTRTMGAVIPPTPAPLPHLFDQNLPPLPPLIIDSYTSFMTALTELTPTAIHAIIQFFAAAVTAITPSVLVSLVVRLGVFFSALRIIPFIRDPRNRRMSWRRNPTMFILYSYAPSFMIAVYSHLLIQHFGGIVHVPRDVKEAPLFDLVSINNIWLSSRTSWQFWNWANIFLTLTLYGYELLVFSSSRPDYTLPGTAQ